ITARDQVIGLTHAQDLDELAGVLKAAEVGAVVDALLSEGLGESRQSLQLFEGRLVEAGADDHGAGRCLGKRDLDLLAILEAACQVGQPRGVDVSAESARGRDGVENAIAARQAVQTGILHRAEHVHQEPWLGRDIEGGVVGGSGRRVGCGGRHVIYVRADRDGKTKRDRGGEEDEPLPTWHQSKTNRHGPSLGRGAEHGNPACKKAWFPGKDSNLRSRIQSPLPYRLATRERPQTVPPGYRTVAMGGCDLKPVSYVASDDEKRSRARRGVAAWRGLRRLPVSWRPGL